MKRMTITQHVPRFVDLDTPPKTAKFRCLSELLKISFVKTWSDRKGFVRFSVCPSDGPGDAASLMAEFKDSFWVVGDLSKEYEALGLPIWECPE